MKIIVQRVKSASVKVNGTIISAIEKGLLLLVGIEKGDTRADLTWCASKIAKLRIFDDQAGKMNQNLLDVQGEILSVSQFTLAAKIEKGNRPSFTEAENPIVANEKIELFNDELRKHGYRVKTGQFQAEMEVSLINDGPVTILVESKGRI